MIELRFHHVGIGTTDFEAAIDTYVAMGHRLEIRVDDPGLNIRVAFLACPDPAGPWIEILGVLEPGGPLDGLIKRRVLPSPYHTCYTVQDLDLAGSFLREIGFVPLSDPRPALAFSNARIQFSYHPAIGLIELVESPPPFAVPA